MSTTFNAPFDGLSWPQPLESRFPVRRPIAGSATHAGATPVAAEFQAIRVTPEIIRAAAARAHAERNAAFRRAFRRLFSRPMPTNTEL